MFTPKTEKISNIYQDKYKAVDNLDQLMQGNAMVYIDYANVRPWCERLGWHMDTKRLKQFLDSFEQISEVKIYQGTLEGDEQSESEISLLHKYKYIVRTKPVKLMKISIDITSITDDSTAILKNFIRRALLRRMSVQTIENLNKEIEKWNKQGELYIEDRKCNFDVEMGTDMLLDYERNQVDTVVFFSGDSDFADSVQRLLAQGKRVVLIASARLVARELSEMKQDGLIIYDVRKLAKFLCWNRELTTVK